MNASPLPKRALKHRLRRQRLTHAQLAQLAHVERSSVTHWLAGRFVSQNIEAVVTDAVAGRLRTARKAAR